MAKRKSPTPTASPLPPKGNHIEKRSLAGLIYTLISAIIIIVGTFFAVQWANGSYRFSKSNGPQSTIAKETGLLSANSYPTKASVYVNDKLITATDDVIYLEPGQYDVKILKDGYSTWQKTLTIEKSLVTSTDALLIPITPSLTSLTFTGAQNLSVSPDGLKIVYFTASTSAKNKNGLYMLDINATGFNANPKLPKQITDNDEAYDLANAQIIWSSDSNQILLKTDDGTFLLSVYDFSPLASQPDVSFKEKMILSEWEDDMATREQQFLSKYPPAILDIITTMAQDVYLSPDKKKLLYTATNSAQLPTIDSIFAPAANSQPQERELQPGRIYVYDLEEDRNFYIGNQTQLAANESEFPTKTLISTSFAPNSNLPLNINNIASVSAYRNELVTDNFTSTINNFKAYHSSLYTDTYQWLSDSKNLVRVENDQVRIIGYDGTNAVTLYSGQLGEKFLYPWPDGSKLLILTSFNPEAPNNIYAIELKK